MLCCLNSTHIWKYVESRKKRNKNIKKRKEKYLKIKSIRKEFQTRSLKEKIEVEKLTDNGKKEHSLKKKTQMNLMAWNGKSSNKNLREGWRMLIWNQTN